VNNVLSTFDISIDGCMVQSNPRIAIALVGIALVDKFAIGANQIVIFGEREAMM
jgi:hypothetical protein